MAELVPKKILMVEDDEMMRILFRDTFWIYGSTESKIEVATVTSVKKAREYLADAKNPRPDIIFLGLALLTPEEDGIVVRETKPSLEFIQELRKTKEFAKIPIIVYSRFSENELKEKAKEAGADHYVVKGELAPKEIIDFVQQL